MGNAPVISEPLRNIIGSKFQTGMPEDIMAIALKAILNHLILERESRGQTHPEIHSGILCFTLREVEGAKKRATITIDYSKNTSGGATGPVNQDAISMDQSIKKIAFMALEMAYGPMPPTIHRGHLADIEGRLNRIFTHVRVSQERYITYLPNTWELLNNGGIMNELISGLQAVSENARTQQEVHAQAQAAGQNIPLQEEEENIQRQQKSHGFKMVKKFMGKSKKKKLGLNVDARGKKIFTKDFLIVVEDLFAHRQAAHILTNPFFQDTKSIEKLFKKVGVK